MESRATEWRQYGHWHELWINGVNVGCVREGAKRKGWFFIAPYGQPSYSRNDGLDDAKRSLEKALSKAIPQHEEMGAALAQSAERGEG